MLDFSPTFSGEKPPPKATFVRTITMLRGWGGGGSVGKMAAQLA